VLALHGAGVAHHEAEACFEPVLEGVVTGTAIGATRVTTPDVFHRSINF
jgi:hypothetical protein